MKNVFLFACLAITMNCFAIGKNIKGNGILKSETRDIGAFTSLSSGGPMNVEITYGTSSNLTIEGDENILPYIETFVKNGTLKIKVKDLNTISPRLKLKVQISMTTMSDISQSGSGMISGRGNFENGKITNFNISGSGKIDLAFAKFDGVNISMSGSGSIELKGDIDGDLDLHQSGSGFINCLNAPCDNVSANMSGSGTMKVNAAEIIDAHISGSGEIYYTGTASISSHVSGSGHIRKV
ncbi:head GIN domain-containing protein [soil metagenome]